MKLIFRISVLLLLIVTSLSAQHHTIDSLKKVLTNTKQDTDRVNTLLQLGKILFNNNPDTCIVIGRQALEISVKDKYGKGISKALLAIGVDYDIKGDLKNALLFVDSALVTNNEYDYTDNLNSVYNELGNIFSDQNNYNLGLYYYFKALAIDSATGKRMTAALCSNIGLNYQELGNYLYAERYYLITKKIYEETNDVAGMASIDCNLGNLYYLQNNYPKGLDNNLNALKIDSIQENLLGLISDYQSVGLGYSYLGNYANSLIYAFKSILLSTKTKEFGNLQIAFLNIAGTYIDIYKADSGNIGFKYKEAAKQMYIPHSSLLDSALVYAQKAINQANKVSDKVSIISATRQIGDIFVIRKVYVKAIFCYQKAYDMADSLGVLQQQMDFSEVLGETYAKAGDYQSAIKYLNKCIILKDTIFGKEKGKQMAEMEAKYETSKKDNEITLLNKERENEGVIAAEKNRKLIVIIISIGLILVLLLSFGVFIYRSLNKTRRQKQTIEVQKERVDKAYNELDVKNKEILSSITYAKRLQDAILPPLSIIRKYLPESFVLYKPKDIVAGDFYWMERSGDNILIAACDCTGHGVPGAMVSVVCSNALNRTVKEFKIMEPGKILDKVRELVVETFEKSESEVQDGMDVSLCCLNIVTKEIQWSGSNNPLWYVQNGELKEVMPDKQPIGKFGLPKPFNTASLKLQKGDTLYLFTDGYADQFGGPKGKKFKYKQMQEKLLAISSMNMDKQKEVLNKTIEDWKGILEQVDDMLVIGIRV